MFSRLLPEVPFPKMILKSIRNRLLFDNEYYAFNDEGIQSVATKAIKNMVIPCWIIIKGSRYTGFGRGVKKYYIETKQNFVDAITEWKEIGNFIVQEFVEQHAVLASFNQSSSNMIRVCSWRHENEVDILFAGIRAGIPGAVTDVSYIDGVEQVRIIGVSNNGIIGGTIRDAEGNVKGETEMKGVKFPCWDSIVEIIKHNAKYIDNFDIIGWDFTVDKNDNPICFEWNIQWPGTIIYQFVNGPLYGDKTDKVLSFLKDSTNQFNYIPFYMK